jgi:hypothetical protein
MITAVELENQPKNNHGDRQTFLAPEVVKDRQPARGNSAKVPVCINPRRDPMFDYKTIPTTKKIKSQLITDGHLILNQNDTREGREKCSIPV